MAPVVERDPTSAAKYADYDQWVPFNVARVGALGLHHSKPQRMLDIGCGPGYFLAAATGRADTTATASMRPRRF